jgi:hypothetical protein
LGFGGDMTEQETSAASNVKNPTISVYLKVL